MNKKNLNLLYGLGIVVIAVLIFSWYQHGTNQQYASDIAKVNPNCAKYDETSGQGPDPITTELSDYANLHPLSDFLCGGSIINKKTQSDGKVLYLVAINGRIDCGNGGCTTQALLEEQPGLVRHIRSLSGWYDHNLNLIN